MHYKGFGYYRALSVFRADIVVGPKKKRRITQGLGLTLQRDNSFAGIYFDLNKARLIHKRLGKVIREIEEREVRRKLSSF